MAIIKKQFVCQQCGAVAGQWLGQCADCSAWNSYMESIPLPPSPMRAVGYAGTDAQLVCLEEVTVGRDIRLPTQLSEFDHVLGGGLVSGSVVLIGGDPGIGKSTLLLQVLAQMTEKFCALYVTGEESLQQVALRAQRLELHAQKLHLLAETQVERIIALAEQKKPQIMVVDSVQTVFTERLSSAPGSVSQVRESAAQLVRFAKRSGTCLILVGHVTKEGTLAGPRVLEHMVDTVLYFEGESSSTFRVIRAIKNRFGAVNELGVFAMTDRGLRAVNNPSAIFLSRYSQQVAGSAIMATWEGTRPLLVEVQALVDTSHLGNPRRVVVGMESNRLAMLLAVLHRHGGIATYDQDVFINVVGGLRVVETAGDLAVILAVYSSLRNQPLPTDLVVFGELGLSGEIRPVPSGQARLHEAAKQGFKRAIVPSANAPKKERKNKNAQEADSSAGSSQNNSQGKADLQIIAVDQLQQALAVL